MSIKTIPDLTAVDALADEDLLVAHDASANATRSTTVGAVRAGMATTDALAAEVAARAAHEAAANPHGGSASTTDLATVGAAVTTHAARIDNPHEATAAQVGAIPATSGAATAYVSVASETAAGISELATLTESVAGTDTARVPTVAGNRQAVLSLMRDSLGKFPGITPPSLNFFCGNATSDTAPAGTFTRSTTGTRLGQAGLIETVAAGSVRREWDAGGVLQGWRIEGLRTNLITYSEQLDNAAWGKYNTTVSSNEAIAPDGNTTADKIIESSASSTHVVYKTVATTLSSIHTFCIFVKKSERSRFMLYIFNNGSQSNYIRGNFDLEAQTFSTSASGNGSATQANLIDLGDGWYLASITGTPDTAAGSGIAYLQIRLLNASGDESYQGDGTSGLYAWGVQLEMAAAPSSYIPTTSAAVARAADVWTVVLANDWFNTTAGALFIAGKTAPGLPPSGGTQVLAMFDDGTALNRFYIWRVNTGNIYFSAIVGGVATSPNLGVISDNTAFKIVVTWSSTNVSAVINGNSPVTSTITAVPTLSNLRIGLSSSGTGQWGGHINHLAYFPVALSDVQLQAITL